MKKKIVAMVLSTIMCLELIPINTFAVSAEGGGIPDTEIPEECWDSAPDTGSEFPESTTEGSTGIGIDMAPGAAPDTGSEFPEPTTEVSAGTGTDVVPGPVPDTDVEWGDEWGTDTGTDSFIDQGTCGASLNWTLDQEGTLCIKGVGRMQDFASQTQVPWSKHVDKIKAASLEDTVESIGNYAFSDCSQLTSVNFPVSLVEIGDYAFNECTVLSGNLHFSDQLGSIGSYAFHNCRGLMGTLDIPDNVTSVGEGAFSGCSGIDMLYLSAGMAEIAAYTFQNCTGLWSSLNIPDNIASIGSCAFEGCEGIGSVVLGTGVTDISYDSMNGCYGVYQIEFKSQYPNPWLLSYGSFLDGLWGMQTVMVPSGCYANYAEFGEMIKPGVRLYEEGAEEFIIDNDTLVAYQGGASEVIVPEGITKIGTGAFLNNVYLEKVVLPEKVENIGRCAFLGCSGLSSINWPCVLTSIGDFAFQNCISLSGDLNIPDSVTTIGDSAFAYCTGYTGSLHLPDDLTILGWGSFDDCNGLSGDLIIPDGVKELESRTFSDCIGFKKVVIGNSVETIDDYSMDGCSEIEEIVFKSNHVPKIDTQASDFFNSMSKLKKIYVRQECVKEFQNKYKSEIPANVIIYSDEMVPVTNLKTDYTGSHSVELSWDVYTGERLAGYNIYRDGIKIADVKTNGYVDSNLQMEIQYRYEVTTYDANGIESEKSGINVMTKKPKVTKIYTDNKFNKVGKTNGRMYAAVDNTNNLKEAKGRFYYLDEKNQEIQIGSIQEIPTFEHGQEAIFAENWNIDHVTAGTYKVYFELKDKDGEKAVVEQDITVDPSCPEALSKVIAVGDTHQVSISWTISHEIDTEIYQIYRKGENEESYTKIKTINDRNILSYTDTAVEDDQKYYYYVIGVNDFGQEGPRSNIATAIPKSDKELPRIIKMNPVNESIINGTTALYASAEDNIAVTKMEFYVSKDDGVTWNLLNETETNECRFSINTETYDVQEIKVKCCAYDAAGNISNPVIYHYKIDNQGPEKVQGLSYESTANTVTLRWKDVADQDIAFFRVEEKQKDGSFKKIEDIYTTLGVNIYNLKSNTEYVYRVVAYDKLGNRGVVSDEIKVKTLEDNINPVITSILPRPACYNKKIPLDIIAEDNEGIASIVIQTSANAVVWEDYKTITYGGINKRERISQEFFLDSYPEGNLYIRAVAQDTNKNESDTSEKAPYVQYVVDRTAPEMPKNFKANTTTGAIELKWDMGKEVDIDGYSVYRSSDDINYSLLADGLHTINYWDREVEKEKTYWYKICVKDTAGNISVQTDAIQAVLPIDEEKPVIESYAPESGKSIGEGNNRFSVLVSDNWKIDSVQVIYTVNDVPDEKILVNQLNVNKHDVLLEKQFPIENLQDGDILHLKVYVTDVQGLKTVEDNITYVIDKKAPFIHSVQPKTGDEMITVCWTGNEEQDLAGYRVYRKTDKTSYALIGQRSVKNSVAYDYNDYNVVPKEVYTYKVEAIDQCGNTYVRESEPIELVIEPTVSAKMNCENTMELGVEYRFDATESFADLGIERYQFDFGDGTILEGAESKVVHKYTALGEYQVTLTVFDIQGKQSRLSKTINVEESKLLGNVKIRVVDVNGNKIAGIPVFFDLDNTSENVKYTDLDGYVQFRAGANSYSVGSYADGYLPVKKSIVVKSGEEIGVELKLIKKQIVTGTFEVDRMTFDEIVAAGIDVKDPENQHIMKMHVVLHYGTQPINMNIVTNGKKIYSGETVIVDTNEGKRQLTASVIPGISSGGGNGGTLLPGNEKNTLIAIMDVPVEASFLKEFFDVKLHIINNADSEFELVNNYVKLNVPKGMTIVESNNTTKNDEIYIDTIKGQEQKTLNWILRGDVAGTYNLEADYTGILKKFNQVINAKFTTDTPITVYGLDAVELNVDVDTSVEYGGLYFDLGLKNIGKADMYLPKINVGDQIIDVYERSLENPRIVQKGVKILGTSLTNAAGYTQELKPDATVDVLSAGEMFKKRYVVYNAITQTDIAYLNKAVYKVAGDLGIKVNINIVNMDLFSVAGADEKINQILISDQGKRNLYEYFINDKNFDYYVDAIADDKNFLKKLGERFYQGTDMVLNLDPDIFTHDSTKDITRQYIYELLLDESFNQSVCKKIDDTYLKITESTINTIRGMLPNDKSGVLVEDATIQNIVDTLGEAKNIQNLTTTLKEGGMDSFWDRLLIVVKSTGISGAEEIFKLKIQKSDIVGMMGSELSSQLKEVNQILKLFDQFGVAWNKSAEITQQLVTINSSYFEAKVLFEAILKHKEINRFVYEEVQRLNEGLDKGFQTQQSIFCDEFMKSYQSSLVNQIANEMVIKNLDAIFCPNAVIKSGTVIAIFKVAFGTFDYLFGWGDSVEEIQSLRVAATLTYALNEETKANMVSGISCPEKALSYLKYLIKMRLVGQKMWINLQKDQGITERESYFGDGKKQSLDDYYLAYKAMILSYRDELFGTIPQKLEIPMAPNVTIDYNSETTAQSFDSGYEYSFDGANWKQCTGQHIELNPQAVPRHLWVRAKETKESFSGNVAKLYVPEKETLNDNIIAKYKAGNYYISSVNSEVWFEGSDIEMAQMQNPIKLATSENGKDVVQKGDYHPYLLFKKCATQTKFESQIKSVPVERAKNVVIVNDEQQGKVTGTGEYFSGENVVIKAIPNEGYKFVGWYLKDQLISNEPEYTFMADKDIELTAKYKKQEYVKVTFIGHDHELLSENQYIKELNDPSKIIIPQVTVPKGYRLEGWLVEGRLYDSSNTQKMVLERFKNNTEIIVKLKLVNTQQDYLVHVTNGLIENGKTDGRYYSGVIVIVRANAPETGKKFAYWEQDGKILSYNATYKFYMPSSDLKLRAVYTNDETKVEKGGITYIERVTPDQQKKWLSFVSISTVPAGSVIEFAGVVATSDAKKATGKIQLTAQNADYVRGGGAGNITYKHTWTKSRVKEEQIWYVRAYLKYKDQSGKMHEIYGDLVQASLSNSVL